MVVLGVVISVVITVGLNSDLETLEQQTFGAPTGAGQVANRQSISEISRDLRNLRSVTYGTLGGGFIITYGGLVFIVWRGWRTISKQRDELEFANLELENRVERRVEELREANRQLSLEVTTRVRAEDDLRRSRERITTAEDSVRKEIAEMLHGRVQTSLLLAWHRLGECEAMLDSDPAEAKKLLVRIRDEVEQIREREVRQASHLLHPSIIRIGLLPAVRSLLAQMKEDLSVSLQSSPELVKLDDPVENRIPEEVRLVAYRILEEGLNNVRRHAKASSVEVSLGVDEGRILEMSIKDDGRGFDTSQMELGFGLNAIEDRVGVTGGTWDIQSTLGPPAGTRLSVRLPLRNLEPNATVPAVAGDNNRTAV